MHQSLQWSVPGHLPACSAHLDHHSRRTERSNWGHAVKVIAETAATVLFWENFFNCFPSSWLTELRDWHPWDPVSRWNRTEQGKSSRDAHFYHDVPYWPDFVMCMSSIGPENCISEIQIALSSKRSAWNSQWDRCYQAEVRTISQKNALCPCMRRMDCFKRACRTMLRLTRSPGLVSHCHQDKTVSIFGGELILDDVEWRRFQWSLGRGVVRFQRSLSQEGESYNHFSAQPIVLQCKNSALAVQSQMISVLNVKAHLVLEFTHRDILLPIAECFSDRSGSTWGDGLFHFCGDMPIVKVLCRGQWLFVSCSEACSI